MKRAQHKKRCNVKRVQHEKKGNMKTVQHEKKGNMSASREKFRMKRLQYVKNTKHENSAT